MDIEILVGCMANIYEQSFFFNLLYNAFQSNEKVVIIWLFNVKI